MPTTRIYTAVFLILLVLTGLALAAEPHHAKVEIKLDAPGAAEFVRANRGRLDILQAKPGSYVHIAAKPGDLEFLRASGQDFEILQADMETANAYSDKGIGYGIYHTYSETFAFVDSLRLLYPNVISQKWSIGQTLEGRDLWAFRVSDNPDIDENEPEILIDAMHHAREIMSSEFTIMFAEYLAQNYGTDPEITWLVDNRELYIVPVVNPDGSVYNETNSPSGGGMWRKNRRDNGDGTFGVDPNRNYTYMWGYDDSGSSPDPSSEVYRGPSAGSELEIQAMMNFINSREIRTHDTIHTYSNLTLYPWGYISTPTSDGAIFDHMGVEMTKYNGYTPGQPGAILYTVNGGTFDWAYGATGEHAKIFSFSNEIGSGSDGFWPAESRREPLFQENIWPHIYLMRVAGAFVTVHSPVVAAGTKSINPGESGILDFTVENQSVFDAVTNLDITIRTDDPWIQLGSASRTIPSLGTMGSVNFSGDPIPLTVDAACPDGHLVQITVTAHMAEGDIDFPLSFPIGTPVVLFSDDMEIGPLNWTTTGQWGMTGSTYNSPVSSLTDSPGGNYSDQSFTTATLNQTFSATGLSFWHKYDIESNYDYGRVQISADGGPWTTVASYTGLALIWEQVTIDLSLYAGQDIALRFAMETDYSVVEDGWYIDDVVLTGFPSQTFFMDPPLAVSPVEGETVGATPTLAVSPVIKASPLALGFGFRIYGDELCSDLVASANDVPHAGSQTTWTAPSLPDGNYWWRAWAGDGTDRSDLCQPVGFIVNDVSAVGDVVIGGPRLRVLGNVTGSQSRLELSLPGQTDVTVDIHDARGARIRQLFTGSMTGGSRVLVWDGRDSHGQAVASGVYFVRMDTGRESFTDRVVIVR
ncbi:MAG: M14 family zinc carboxypeptidase [Candidatus Krumholzibacteriota bacterium]